MRQAGHPTLSLAGIGLVERDLLQGQLVLVDLDLEVVVAGQDVTFVGKLGEVDLGPFVQIERINIKLRFCQCVICHRHQAGHA